MEQEKKYKRKYYPSQSTNLAKRFVLEGIGHLIMSDLDQDFLEWDELKKNFKSECCYCGTSEAAGAKLTQEHLHMIKDAGLHHVGNVVPACDECNRERKKVDWEGFLKGKCKTEAEYDERYNRIKKHIDDYKYEEAVKHDLAKNLNVFVKVFPRFLEENIKKWLEVWTDRTGITKTPKGDLTLKLDVKYEENVIAIVEGGYEQNQPISTSIKNSKGILIQQDELEKHFQPDEIDEILKSFYFVEMVIEAYDTDARLD
ncbi:hypothetical protein V7075_24820 [Neobacillus drentensis]|uniref:HNH endonuclease n=1 Tax=Neobacillus drentensis TaxID=220684 RepID=UPI002FFD8697